MIAKKALFIDDLLGDIAMKKEAANALKPTGPNKTDIKPILIGRFIDKLEKAISVIE